jgi:hypothetical protein
MSPVNALLLDISKETSHTADHRGLLVVEARDQALVAADGSGRADGSRHRRSYWVREIGARNSRPRGGGLLGDPLAGAQFAVTQLVGAVAGRPRRAISGSVCELCAALPCRAGVALPLISEVSSPRSPLPVLHSSRNVR